MQKSLQSETIFVSKLGRSCYRVRHVKKVWQNQIKLLQVFYSSKVTMAKTKYFSVPWIFIRISDRLLEKFKELLKK